MALNTDYRPQSLDELIGNEALVEALKGALRRDKPFQTYLITGPSGCGKTTIAGIIKNELECSDHDYTYFNASNTRGIDTVREVIEKMQMSPMAGKVRLFVFDECHQLTRQAQEALLKDTEEPPPHVYFIFCTTEPEKLQVTFKRRGFQGQVEKLIRNEVIQLMKEVLESEIAEAEDAKDTKQAEKLKQFPGKLLSKIATLSEGSPGQALKLLDQVVNMDYAKAEVSIHTIFGDEASTLDIGRTLVDDRIKWETKWLKIQKLIDTIQVEPEIIRKGVLTYLYKVFVLPPPREDIAEMITLLSESTFYSYKAGLAAQLFYACKCGEVINE